jgi:hypothetical protein
LHNQQSAISNQQSAISNQQYEQQQHVVIAGNSGGKTLVVAALDIVVCGGVGFPYHLPRKAEFIGIAGMGTAF